MLIRRKLQRGFTLVELLVTITIFVVLTGVVLFNQQKFNSTILLTNLAYDTALTIRQAQTYGINIKEFNGADEFVPYGVHFDLNSEKSFILYADTGYNLETKNLTSYNGVLTKCEADDGCVSRYNILRGNYISDLCVNSTGSKPDGDCGKQQLDILFVRPNPDAFIRTGTNKDEGNNYDATIIIKGVDETTRKIKVSQNGLIEIKH